MATFGQEEEGRGILVPPVAPDERVAEVPVTDLDKCLASSVFTKHYARSALLKKLIKLIGIFINLALNVSFKVTKNICMLPLLKGVL